MAGMIVPLLALAMTAGEVGKASRLYHSCKDLIAITDHTARKDASETLEAGRCLGYVDGFIQGSFAHPFACSGEATNETIVRVYIAYMDKNPKLLDEIEGVTFLYAMKDAYPCPAK
jgi:Rap1a immunity proteins